MKNKPEILKILNEGLKENDMIIVTDQIGKVLLYNNMLSQLCNFANKDEILLQKVNISQLFVPIEENFNDIWKELNEHLFYSGKINFSLSYNQLIPFKISAYKIGDEHGGEIRFVFFFKLEELNEIEKDPLEQNFLTKLPAVLDKTKINSNLIASIEELERLKEDFLSSVSHELRTPLTSIIGFAETLKSDSELPKEIYTEFLDIILNEGKRLAATINDLLDISQLYKEELKLQIKNVELQELVSKTFEQFRPIAKNIAFGVYLPEKPIFIQADENKLQQAINNLVSNAIKFTPPNGQVKISIYEIDKEYIIEVSDTGYGIPEKDKDKIFDRFYRVYRPGLEIRGVGLGLSITKKILDLHNFKLEFESQENKGSTFKIFIPK